MLLTDVPAQLPTRAGIPHAQSVASGHAVDLAAKCIASGTVKGCAQPPATVICLHRPSAPFPALRPAGRTLRRAVAAGPRAQVGVGGFVLNERREVLVVQERNGPLKGKGVWKMPTGLVSEGEDLHEAAAREILEETVRAASACLSERRMGRGDGDARPSLAR